MDKIENKAEYAWAVRRMQLLLPFVDESTPVDDPHYMEFAHLAKIVSAYRAEYMPEEAQNDPSQADT